MPKIIENVRERAISLARDLLIREGYAALTVRRVATSMGIAPATIYNYFPSKDNLIACIMLEDWQKLMAEFEENNSGHKSPEDICRALFSTVHSFSQTYVDSWNDHKTDEQSISMRRHYHPLLVEQLNRHILRSLTPERAKEEPWLSPFLADLILRFGSDGETDYMKIEPAIKKLLKLN